MPPPGIEPATSCFPACPSHLSAVGTVNDMLFKLLQYFFTRRYYKNSVLCAMEIFEHCLLTVSWLIPFKYEMIYIKEEIYYVLYVNDYI